MTLMCTDDGCKRWWKKNIWIGSKVHGTICYAPLLWIQGYLAHPLGFLSELYCDASILEIP